MFREEDLCKPIIDFFAPLGYKIYAEILDCDLALIKDNDLILVELKKIFCIKLLYQAIERQKISKSVYVALPRLEMTNSRNFKNAVEILERLGLGLLLIATDSPKQWVEVVLIPNYDKNPNGKARKKLIDEMNGRVFDTDIANTGGSSRRKIMTAYRETSIRLACALEAVGATSAVFLKKNFGFGKNTGNILLKNYYGWFTKTTQKGIYDLSETGRRMLEGAEFSRFIEYYRKEFENFRED
ncbi:MAG: DUF2161 family putative PD-(D/E)XK-type phosphodiesterase [Defluviitaleaceae bacterium]|nr:DUF2161 family putative PD-(D/E)XK-type phosphodiesterase [Defluviitaleaceae bacterium]